jgi:hypothetical protein
MRDGDTGHSQGARRQRIYKVGSAPLYPALKGASDFGGVTVSLKRYPDTKPEFFGKL